MSSFNRRLADRIPVEVPVELDTNNGIVEAETMDVSRTGMRIHVRARDLGHAPSLEMSETAAHVAAALSPRFAARLHFRMLGPLLERVVRMTRLSIPSDRQAWIEIGCRFDEPLTLEDATTLGVPLPPVEGTDEEFCPRADVAGPHHREAKMLDLAEAARRPPAQPVEDASSESGAAAETPASIEDAAPVSDGSRFGGMITHRYRAFVTSTESDVLPPIVCQTDQLSRIAVRVRLPREGYESDDAAGATIRFTERYGNDVGLKLVDGSEHLWTGPARVFCVEVPEDVRTDVLVTLAFGRRLRPAELRRLRLNVDVA